MAILTFASIVKNYNKQNCKIIKQSIDNASYNIDDTYADGVGGGVVSGVVSGVVGGVDVVSVVDDGVDCIINGINDID